MQRVLGGRYLLEYRICTENRGDILLQDTRPLVPHSFLMLIRQSAFAPRPPAKRVSFFVLTGDDRKKALFSSTTSSTTGTCVGSILQYLR